MENQNVLKLFEEVKSVKNSEGTEALTAESISELCKKYGISMTELKDLVMEILSAGEIKKFSSDEVALENVAGGKMDFKKGTATLLAALNVAGPFASSTFAKPLETQQNRRPITAAHARRDEKQAQNTNQDPKTQAKNDGGAIKFVQNTFGVSHTIATGIVGATKVLVPVLALAGIYKGVNGLLSNKSSATDPYAEHENDQQKQLCTLPADFTSEQFKHWLVDKGAIDLSDDKYETVHDLITALKSYNNTTYPNDVSKILLFHIFTSPKDNDCRLLVANIARFPQRYYWFPSDSNHLSCGGNLSKSRSFAENDLPLLLKNREIPVIIVNDAVITDVIEGTSKAYPEPVIKNSDDTPRMLACAPDILNAFNNALKHSAPGSTPPASPFQSPSEGSGSYSSSNDYEASARKRKEEEERKRKEEEERRRKAEEERKRKEEERKRKEEEERRRKAEEERKREEEEERRSKEEEKRKRKEEEERRRKEEERKRKEEERKRKEEEERKRMATAADEFIRKKEETARKEVEEKILQCPCDGKVIELNEEQTIGSITQAALHLKEFVLIQYTKKDGPYDNSGIMFFAPTRNQTTLSDINRVLYIHGRDLSPNLNNYGWGYNINYAYESMTSLSAEKIANELNLPVIILQNEHLHPLLKAGSDQNRRDFIETLHSIAAQEAEMNSISSVCGKLVLENNLNFTQLTETLSQLRDGLSNNHIKSFLTKMITKITSDTFLNTEMPKPEPTQVADIPACHDMLCVMKVLWDKAQNLATEAAARQAEKDADHQRASLKKRTETEKLMQSVTIPGLLLRNLECIPRKYDYALTDVRALKRKQDDDITGFMFYGYSAYAYGQQEKWATLFGKITDKRNECNKYLAEAIIGIRDSLEGKGFSADVLATLTSLVDSNTYIPENLPEDFYDNFGTTVGPLLQNAHDSLVKFRDLCDLCCKRISNMNA